MSCFQVRLTLVELTPKILTSPSASARRLCELLFLECLFLPFEVRGAHRTLLLRLAAITVTLFISMTGRSERSVPKSLPP